MPQLASVPGAGDSAGRFSRRTAALLVASAVVLVAVALVVAMLFGRARTGTDKLPGTTVFVSSKLGGYVYKIATDGTLSIIAGTGDREAPPKPGPAIDSPVVPTGIALDGQGNLYVAEPRGHILKITVDGTLSIVANAGAGHVAVDANGTVYFTDMSQVRRVNSDGTTTAIAGVKDQIGKPTPGPAIDSHLTLWGLGLTIDSDGNIYVCDSGYVDKITPAGILSIIAGTGNINGSPTPGPATQSAMQPADLAMDNAGNLFIADYNGYVEKVTPDGTLSIVAQRGESLFPTAAPATNSFLLRPNGIAMDAADNIYLADDSGPVEQITAGTLFPIGGRLSGITPTPGPALQSPMAPFSVAVQP